MTPRSGARDAPGPPGLPLIGHVPPFLRDKLGFLSRCAHDYGEVVRLAIGGRTYLLTSPDDVRHVLLSGAYEKTARIIGSRARRFFGDGLVTRTGTEHLRHRRMLQPCFHSAVVQSFAAVMVDTTEEMIETWKPGMVLDVHQAMLDLTQRVILRLLLSDAGVPTLERLARAITVRRRYQEYLLGSRVPFAEWLPTPWQRMHVSAERDIARIIHDAIGQRRRESGDAPQDLLQLLVQARFDDGSHMSDRQVVDEVRSLAIAGYETLAEALTWTWYLLAQSPHVDSAVAAEVAAIPRDRPLKASDLGDLPYCRMVLAEAMRLYPPTWLFVRVAREHDVLPTGFGIPAGSRIYLSQWVMHRHPAYFPHPERFDPGRFTEAAVRTRPRFAYFPFGGGRRLCIGEDFAWMEGVLLLAAITRRFRLALMPDQTVVPEPNVTLRPRHGVRVEICLR